MLRKYSFVLFVLVLSAIGFAQSRETRMGVNGSSGSSGPCSTCVTTDTVQTITGQKTFNSNTQLWQGGRLFSTLGSAIIDLRDDAFIKVGRGAYNMWVSSSEATLFHGSGTGVSGYVAAQSTGAILNGGIISMNNGPRINTAGGGSKPTCAAGTRGTLWYVSSGAGVADSMEICAKSSLDAYAWRSMATIP